MLDMSPGMLLSGLVLSMLGTALFLYGKKSEQFDTLAGGLALIGLPMVVHSLLWLWLAAAACFGGVFVLRRVGG